MDYFIAGLLIGVGITGLYTVQTHRTTWQELGRATAERDIARKHAGKLSRIIGRQRWMMRKYKAEIARLTPESEKLAKIAAAKADKAMQEVLSH